MIEPLMFIMFMGIGLALLVPVYREAGEIAVVSGAPVWSVLIPIMLDHWVASLLGLGLLLSPPAIVVRDLVGGLLSRSESSGDAQGE